MSRLAEKVAVITGGGNGIGRGCAIRFAAEGAKVVVADLSIEAASETAALVKHDGGEAEAVVVNVADADDNAAMAELAVESFGRLDVLVTAAGISHGNYVSGDVEADVKMFAKQADYAARPGWDFVEYDMGEWAKVLAVNLTGTVLSMQACVRAMLEAGNGGSIVTISSIAGKHPDAGPLAYTASKAGVWMTTKKVARLLAPADIRVNSIGPGFIETHMTQVMDKLSTAGAADMFSSVPMARRGTVTEVANTALFLASDEASYFTGEILHPAGGYFTA